MHHHYTHSLIHVHIKNHTDTQTNITYAQIRKFNHAHTLKCTTTKHTHIHLNAHPQTHT